MSHGPLELDELASIISRSAGISVTGGELAGRPEATFTELEVDSLALLGIVGELERRFGVSLSPYAEKCPSPQELRDFVNSQITSGV